MSSTIKNLTVPSNGTMAMHIYSVDEKGETMPGMSVVFIPVDGQRVIPGLMEVFDGFDSWGRKEKLVPHSYQARYALAKRLANTAVLDNGQLRMELDDPGRKIVVAPYHP